MTKKFNISLFPPETNEKKIRVFANLFTKNPMLATQGKESLTNSLWIPDIQQFATSPWTHLKQESRTPWDSTDCTGWMMSRVHFSFLLLMTTPCFRNFESLTNSTNSKKQTVIIKRLELPKIEYHIKRQYGVRSKGSICNIS